LIAWDKICCPKKFGGLGLQKTAAVNMAFLAKLAWKFFTKPENFWVQLITAKYVTTDCFSIANQSNLIPGFGNVCLVLDLSSSKVYVGNWGMVNP